MLVCRAGYNPKDYDDCNASNLYGESKIAGEKIIKGWSISGYEWLIVRPTSIWGPWFGTPYKDFFKRIKSKTYFKIAGKSSTKTFGFVGNTVYQIDKLLFLEPSLVHKKTFYLGDMPPLNINRWADQISAQLDIRLFSIPFFILKTAGLIGDFLSKIDIKFPVTSFRVRNMTTDNVIDLLKDTNQIISDRPFSIEEGIEITLKWMDENEAT
jgi:nucleoside-diphosphate-sugar epimerase